MAADNTFNGKTVYTLSQVTKSIQSMIERTYSGLYYIKAEMIKLNRYPRTGHCYPELVEKEGSAIKTEMRAIIWASNYAAINGKFTRITGEPLKDGISILCLASITFSPRYGLSLQIQDIEPTYTLGEMARNRIETIQRLKDEDIFDANKRLTMPLLPKRIAVISVETSKGYSDFMIALRDNKQGYRFDTELFPSLLQGEKAVTTMCEQLSRIEKRKEDFDCVAIIRGGGGDVGLNCYDQYELASRVATFPLPILSGIGHSTNETITEMVAFANKITPTEVAYFIIGHFSDFEMQLSGLQSAINENALSIVRDEQARLAQFERQMQLATQRTLAQEKSALLALQSELRLSSYRILESQRHALADAQSAACDYARNLTSREQLSLQSLQTRMQLAGRQSVATKQSELRYIEEKLKILHPDNILRRGFSITLRDGRPVTAASALRPGDKLETVLLNGRITSVVEG